MTRPPVRALILAIAAIFTAPMAAHAASVTFNGGTTGVDPLGQNYNTALGPVGSPQPADSPNFVGFPTFGETAAGNGGNWAVFNGAGLANATSFTFTYTGTQPNMNFNQGFDLGFSQDDGTGAWITNILSPTTVQFLAPGAGLVAGTPFDFIIGFTNSTDPSGFPNSLVIDPSQFSFSATWAGAVPEPATWAMMLIGVGLVGFALRRSRRKAQAAFA